MKIVLITDGDVPPKKYGGTQRVVAWLAKGLLELGHKVYIINDGKCYLKHKNLKFIKNEIAIKKFRNYTGLENIEKYLPEEYDIVHFHFNLKKEPPFPYILTFHWLGKSEEDFNDVILPNTIFVSKRHAENNNRNHYVYHGLDPEEFIYKERKKNRYLFLSKVSYSPKNVKLAIKLAKDMKFQLDVAGGWRLNFSRYIHFKGMVGGTKKKKLLANSKALIFPTLCEEPFGLVTIEALVSGTPVISSNYGAMSEIVTEDVGFRCENYNDYKKAFKSLDKIDSKSCRQRVLDNFTHIDMANNYIKYYKRVLKRGKI